MFTKPDMYVSVVLTIGLCLFFQTEYSVLYYVGISNSSLHSLLLSFSCLLLYILLCRLYRRNYGLNFLALHVEILTTVIWLYVCNIRAVHFLQNNDEEKIKECMDPFAAQDMEEQKKLEALARSFEEKYVS